MENLQSKFNFFSIQQTKSIKKHFGALKQQIPSTGVPVNPKPTSFSWSDKINGKLKKAKPKKNLSNSFKKLPKIFCVFLYPEVINHF